MNIKLYINNSDNNVLNKKISLLNELDVKLKNETDIITPYLILSGDISNNANYLYIPKWNRYYYIINKKSINNGMYEIQCKVDVLMSHKKDILNSDALIYASENLKNNYISSDIYVNDVRETTKILNFANGFNNNPEFVLITAGATII